MITDGRFCNSGASAHSKRVMIISSNSDFFNNANASFGEYCLTAILAMNDKNLWDVLVV